MLDRCRVVIYVAGVGAALGVVLCSDMGAIKKGALRRVFTPDFTGRASLLYSILVQLWPILPPPDHGKK